MKRLFTTVIFGLAFTLVWTWGASASTAPGASTSPRHVDFLQVLRGASPQPAIPFTQAGEQTYPLSGTMEGFDGSPLADFFVVWGWYDPGALYSWLVPSTINAGEGTITGDDGLFSFTGVTSHPGQDSLMAWTYSGAGLYYTILYHLDFSTTGSYVLRPGHVNVSIAHAPPGKRADISFADPDYSLMDSSVGLTDGYGVAEAAPPDFTSARASFPRANGSVTAECEWISPGHAPVAVSPGGVAGTSIAFDWGTAVRGHLLGPRCQHSGRPGSTVRYAISNLPAGAQVSFYGRPRSAPGVPVKVYPQVVTSTGPENTYTVALRIPTSAMAGSVYEIDAQRSDDVQSQLWLSDYYEVCSIHPSRSTIERGQYVRLYGSIDGREATLFMRHSQAGQPATAKAQGWTKAGSFSVHGSFLSTPQRPTRTTWYVVRYRGDGGGFVAFTPVVKVSVR